MVRLGGDASQFVQALAAGSGSVRAFANTTAIAMNSIKGPIGLVVAALMTLATLSVFAFSRFDKAMTESLAIAGPISAQMRKDFEDTARQISESSVYSATAVAEGYYGLISAGLSAAQALEAIPVAATFAMAGVMDLDRATVGLTTSQTALGLVSEDTVQNMYNMERVADVLVEANNRGQGSVEMYTDALANAAGSMRMYGVSLEEGVAMLMSYAAAGKFGAEAGTMYTMFLRDMANKGRANADAFRDLGIAVYDSGDNMRKGTEILADLERRMAGMTDKAKSATLAQLGLTDKSIKSTLAIIGASGATAEFERHLNSAGGAAQEVADKQMESFANKVKASMHAAENAMARLGGHVAPKLVKAMDAISDWLDANGPKIRQVWEQASPVLAAFGNGLLAILEIGYRYLAFITGLGLYTKVVFGAMALGIAALVIAFNGPVAAVVAVIVALGWLKDNWRDAFNTIIDWVEIGANTLIKAFENAVNFVLSILPYVAIALSPLWVPFAVATYGIMKILGFLRDHFWDIVDGITGAAGWLADKVTKLFKVIGENAGGIFSAIGNFIVDIFKKVVGVITGLVDKLPQKVKDKLGVIGNLHEALGSFEFGGIDLDRFKVDSTAEKVARNAADAWARGETEREIERLNAAAGNRPKQAVLPDGTGDALDDIEDSAKKAKTALEKLQAALDAAVSAKLLPQLTADLGKYRAAAVAAGDTTIVSLIDSLLKLNPTASEVKGAIDSLIEVYGDLDEAAKKASDAMVSRVDDLGGHLATALQRQAEKLRDTTVGGLDEERETLQRFQDGYEDLVAGKQSRITGLVEAGTRARLEAIVSEARGIEQHYAAAIASVDSQLKALDAADTADRFKEIDDKIKLAFDPRVMADLLKERTQLERDVERRGLEEKRQSLENTLATERERLVDGFKVVLDARRTLLDDAEALAQATYEASTNEFALQSKVRELLAAGELTVIQGLLNDFVPEWKFAGISYGEQLIQGLEQSGVKAYLTSLYAEMNALLIATGRTAVGAVPATAGTASKGAGTTVTVQSGAFNGMFNGATLTGDKAEVEKAVPEWVKKALSAALSDREARYAGVR